MNAVQLDLFGDVERALRADDEAARARAEWAARFERAPWIAPWDTADGMKKGESKLGWRCPCCGDIEPNDALLLINHGLSDHEPQPPWWDGRCGRQNLREAHAAYDREHADG